MLRTVALSPSPQDWSSQQWNDKSGANYHASQSTADRQPEIKSNSIGGKTALKFDGSDNMGALLGLDWLLILP